MSLLSVAVWTESQEKDAEDEFVLNFDRFSQTVWEELRPSKCKTNKMASCVVVTAVICVLLTTVATIVAFATPNWLKFRGSNPTNLCEADRLLDICTTCDCGLWLRCSGGLTSGNLDNCVWFFADDFLIEQNQPGMSLH